MASKDQWLASANDSLESSGLLSSGERWRSAVSRPYYAAHAAAHAIVVHLDPSDAIGGRSIRHGELPSRLRKCLRKLPNSQVLEKVIHDELVDAYNLRVVADYKPNLPLDRAAYDQARKAASRMLYAARRMTG